MIEVADLRKSFGATAALTGLNFEARDGEVTGLLGPNGAGKTTALRILYGIMQADAGSVRVDGLDVRADTAGVQARLGALPDEPGLYPRLSARENIRYFGRLHGVSRSVIDQRIGELVPVLDMEAIIDRRTEGFSHGERTKTSLVRVLVHNPRNVLLDEPTNGLDVMSVRALRQLIRHLREEGRCVLFSSHVMQEVSALCDRIVVVSQGRAVATGTPEELREKTGRANLEDAFVALTGGDPGSAGMIRLTGAGVVFAKEFLEHARDRRALFSIFWSALIGPALIGFLFYQLAKDQRSAEDVEIPVVGRAYAPELMRWLGEHPGVTIVDGPADPEQAVQSGDVEFALVIEDDFGKRFEQSRPATVKLYYDQARNRARPKVLRARRLIENYSQQMGALRLIARGVSPVVSQPILIEEMEVSSAQRRASRILSFVPLMLLLAGFAAGMSPAVDSTAGERERGSLEPLLINPVSTLAVAAGKWMAAASFAALALGLSLVLLLGLLLRLPLADLGVYFRLEAWQLAGLAAVALPVAMLAPAFQMLVACYARTFKEAQAYLGYVIMIPMVPGVIMLGLGLEHSAWMNLVPMVAQTRLIENLLAGEMPAFWELAVSGGMAVALALLCVYGVSRLLRRERIVFGR